MFAIQETYVHQVIGVPVNNSDIYAAVVMRLAYRTLGEGAKVREALPSSTTEACAEST